MALIYRSSAGRIDNYNGGPYSTAIGTTKKIGTPTNAALSARVVIHDQPTGRIIREIWSDPADGSWQFKNLRAGTFYTVAFDHTEQYNGEVVTGIKLPEHAA